MGWRQARCWHVECPTCEAPVDEPCVVACGYVARGPHEARVRLGARTPEPEEIVPRVGYDYPTTEEVMRGGQRKGAGYANPPAA